VDEGAGVVTMRVKQVEAVEETAVSGGVSYLHPFKVSLTDTSDPDEPLAAITAKSLLYTNLSTLEPITALTTPFVLTDTTKVWLKGTVASYELTGASITTVTPASPVTYASGAQTEFHLLLGRVLVGVHPTAPGFPFTISGVAHHFEQMLNTHLLLRLICNSGEPALYPLAYAGY
jgi:hypothetical protein